MFSTRIFILLIVLSVTVWAQRKKSGSAQKNCDQTTFDKLSANVFGQFGLEELTFPTSRSELSKYCKKAKESTEFAKQYGQNCLKSTSQTLMSLASYNFEKVNKQYCAKNGKLKNEFVSWAKCGNKGKSETIKCWDTMMLVMANAKKVQNSKSRIPLICCTYYDWIKCNRIAMEKVGPPDCPQAAVEGYGVHINKASVDSMNLICSRYEDNPDKCKALYSEVSKNKPKKIHKMPLLYVFDIFDSL